MENTQIGFSNPVIKEFIDLKKGSKDDVRFTLEGISLLKMLLDSPLSLETFIYCEDYIFTNDAKNLLKRCIKEAKESYPVSKKVFEKLTDLDGPDGFVGISSLTNNAIDLKDKKKATILVLDGLETSGNIGTIYRSGDGLGIDGIIITNKRAKITSSKVVKASMGALFYIPTMFFEHTDECYAWLEKNNVEVFLTDTRAEKNYFETDFSKRVALVAGCERYGITKDWYDHKTSLIKIPMLGRCDSLNVAISTIIMTSEVVAQQKFDLKNR